MSCGAYPFDFEFLNSEELANNLRRLVLSNDYDVVQIEHSRMAPYLDVLPAGVRCKSVLTFHNVASIQYDRIAQIELTLTKRIRSWLHGRMLRRWEPRTAERFNRCITVSEVDRRILMAANPRLHVDVIPNGVDTLLYKPLGLERMQPAVLLVGNIS